MDYNAFARKTIDVYVNEADRGPYMSYSLHGYDPTIDGGPDEAYERVWIEILDDEGKNMFVLTPIDYEIALIGGTILDRFRDGDEFADAVEYAMQTYGAPAASVKELAELARKYARA